MSSFPSEFYNLCTSSSAGFPKSSSGASLLPCLTVFFLSCLLLSLGDIVFSEERLRGHGYREEGEAWRRGWRGNSGRDVLYVRKLYFQ